MTSRPEGTPDVRHCRRLPFLEGLDVGNEEKCQDCSLQDSNRSLWRESIYQRIGHAADRFSAKMRLFSTDLDCRCGSLCLAILNENYRMAKQSAFWNLNFRCGERFVLTSWTNPISRLTFVRAEGRQSVGKASRRRSIAGNLRGSAIRTGRPATSPLRTSRRRVAWSRGNSRLATEAKRRVFMV